MVQLPLNIIAAGNDFIGGENVNISSQMTSSQKFLLADFLKSDEFAKDADEDDEDEEEVVHRPYFEDEEYVCKGIVENDTRRTQSTTAVPVLTLQHSIIYEEEEEISVDDSDEKGEKSDKSAESSNNEEPLRREKEFVKENSPSNAILSRVNGQTKTGSPQTPKVTFKHSNEIPDDEEDAPLTPTTAKRQMLLQSKKQWKSFGYGNIEEDSSQTKVFTTQKQPNIVKALIRKRNSEGTTEDLNNPVKIQQTILKNKNGRISGNSQTMPTYEKVMRHKRRKELNLRKSLQTRPRTISAAKERRGVRDYQVALKRIFLGRRGGGGGSGIRSTLQRPICPTR
uniref:Uncharacterized protein n=1 Tax=Meloidogyne hapla TaxID=6305 RepID=A0A1I8BNS7_MELHA